MPHISKSLFLILAILQFGNSDRIYAQQNNNIKILWQKEFIADSNLGYWFGAVMFNQTDNRLLLAGGSCKITTLPPKELAEYWLWEIDANGNMLRNTTVDNRDGKLNPYMTSDPLYLQLTSDENIQVLLHTSSGSPKSISSTEQFYATCAPYIMKVTKGGKVISILPVFEPNYPARSFRDCAMISCPDNSSFVIGHQEYSRPMVIKLDSVGKCLWRKTYPLADRMYNAFTQALPDVGGSGLLAGGFSAGVGDKDYFILRIDSDGNVLSQVMFPCYDPGAEGTWPHLFRMDSGNIMSAMDTNKRHDISEIMIRMYTCDLKPLFEKQLGKLAQENYEESYKIEPVAGGGFALVDDSNNENLVLHLYDDKCNESCCIPLNIASPYYYHLTYGSKRLFILVKTASKKIKIVALDIN